MAIVQHRNPDRGDGTMARVVWKTSVVPESETFGTFQEDATELRIRAELALKTQTAKSKVGIVFSVDEEGNTDRDAMEEAYDSLVPGYFK